MRILIDTNILMRIAQPKSPQHEEALAAVDALYSASHELCLVPQVIYEYWAAATRPVDDNGLELTTLQVQAAVEILLKNYTLLPDDSGIYTLWYDLVSKHQVDGKQAHDARFVAAMLRHGLTEFLTYNKRHFIRFNAIRTYVPADILAGKFPT